MGEALTALLKDLSCCRDVARYVCNDASWSSRCCGSDICCECNVETRPVEISHEEYDLEVEVDDPGCCDVEGLCCFMHASRK